MATETTQDPTHDVLECERRYWQALKDEDVDAATALSDFPVLLTGPQGAGRIERDDFVAMMKNSRYALRDFSFGDTQVRLIGDDTALVAYQVHAEYDVDGQSVGFDAADASTWVRKDGRWVCALHTESILGDPFGRDRQPSA